jgi:hypothetical protein
MQKSAAFKRYYEDTCSATVFPQQAQLSQQVHALYVAWLQANGHSRDYVAALDHVAALFLVSYLLEGAPDLSGEGSLSLPSSPLPSITAIRARLAKKTKPLRLYDDNGNLENALPLEELQKGLAPYFVRWVADAWHPRDFGEALRNTALSVAYSHDISCSMGGLGGCKSEIEFLSQPYQSAVAS